MDLIVTILVFCAALFILVSVHEFGHFYIARRCGVKVLRFCVGMGKPFWSFRDSRGTEFGIAPFPLGGYVKMLDEREGQVAPEERQFAFNRQSPWRRIAILAAGASANFLLALVLFWILAAVNGSTGLTPQVGAVAPGSLAAAAGLETGHIITAVDGKPTPTRQAVFEQLLRRLGETGTLSLSVERNGSSRELQVALDRWLQGAVEPMPTDGLGFEFYAPALVVSEVLPDSAAAQAGLRAEDTLLRVDGDPIRGLNSWIGYVKARPGQEVVLTIERSGQEREIVVVPRPVPAPDGTDVGQVGVMVGHSAYPAEMVVRQDFGAVEVLQQGFAKVASTTDFVWMSLGKLITGEISSKNLSGPIGIAKVAGDQARAGLPYFFEFLAILSVYLGVLNLLPIPVLDGGHIVYCLVEAIKGSPVSERVQLWGFSAGLALLGCVMVLAFYNDIVRL